MVPPSLTDASLSAAILELLEAYSDGHSVVTGLVEPHLEGAVIDRVRSYRDVQMLTRDEGLVVFGDDGSEFQITIVRRR